MTYDVPLPFATKPVFPHRCIACELENPGDTVDVRVLVATVAPSLKEQMVDAVLDTAPHTAGSNVQLVLQPAVCMQCKPSVRRESLIRVVAQYAFPLLGALLFGLALLAHYVVLGIVALIAGILAPVFWSLCLPPRLGATTIGPNLIYEFRSKKVADEFRNLNA